MNKNLYQLLLDNPTLPEQVLSLCQTLPGYEEAERDYHQNAEQIAELVGFEVYDAFEKALFCYTELEIRAYYLFGLGLRQEILRIMELPAQEL